MPIPDFIEQTEHLVRGIVHPLFCSRSKGILKLNAFLPPPRKNEVSMLRLTYTTADFCKNHSAQLSIPNQSYTGLAVLTAGQIDSVNALDDSIRVIVLSSPLPDLEMHADLIYDGFDPSTDDKFPVAILEKARRLAQEKARFYPDPNPLSDGWQGEDLYS